MRHFLGVDGGQSSTTALIGDAEGRVLGFGRGGPCNHVGAAEGRSKFLDAVGGCVRAACESAGLASPTFEGACLGFSGGPADKELLVREFVHAGHLKVTHDALIALSGACAGQPGVITIAGTGSIAFGRNADGDIARSGGWGYAFGDEGGGFDITRKALRAALRYEEGWGPTTSLHSRLLAASGAADANELLHDFYTTEWPRARVASLSKLVDAAAREGDGVAADILNQAARELCAIALAVRRRLFPIGPAMVSYVGGVFRSDVLCTAFRTLIEAEPATTCGPPIYGPAAGALIEAYRLSGLHPNLQNVPEFEK